MIPLKPISARWLRRRSTCFGLGLAALLAEVLALPSTFGQTPQVTFTQTTIMQGPQVNVVGVGVDSAGNVYGTFADQNFANGSAVKATLANGAYTQATLPLNVSHALGLAVDTAGDIFVANGNAVLKETPSGGGSYSESTVVASLPAPYGLAVGADGSVYVADLSGTVYREKPSGGSYTQSTVASGLNNPNGVAVAADGTVYIAETGSHRLLKETPASGAYTQTVVDTTPGQPNAVAVDAAGNVYSVDNAYHLLKDTPAGGSYTQSTLLSLAISPQSLAVATDGSYFVGGSGQVVHLLPNVAAAASGNGSFGTHAVGVDGGTATFTFNFVAGGSLAASPFSVTTQGTPNLDFQPAATQAGTVCATGRTYAAGDSCTVAVHFSATRPGHRIGGVQLYGSNGAAVATAYLQGDGTAPQASFAPGQTAVSGSANQNTAVATDGAGVALVAATDVGLYRQDPATHAATILIDKANGFRAFQMMLDGAGNLVSTGFSQTGNGDAVSIRYFNPSLAVGQQYSSAQLLAEFSGDGTSGVTVDGAGNILVSATGAGNVQRLGYAGLGTYVPSSVGSGLQQSEGVAIDAAGNILVSDTHNNRIVQETPANGSYTQTALLGLTLPGQIALDATGNLYIEPTLFGTSQLVTKETLAAGSYTPSMLPTGGNTSLAVSSAGNVFAVENGLEGNDVVELDVADPPTLTFHTTAVGSTSSDSPQTVTLVNNGNAPMTLALPTSGSNPVITTDFTIGSGSTCPVLTASSATGFTLAPNASCTLQVNFSPTRPGPSNGGFSTGTLTITDDSLNAAGTQQVIQLRGLTTTSSTGSAQLALTPPSHDFGTVATGTTAASTLTLTNSGTAGANITSVSQSNPLFATAATTCGSSIAAGASCTYTVQFSPTAPGQQTSTVSVFTDAGTVTAVLTGTGNAAVVTAPQAALTPVSGSFGTVNLGSSGATQTFTLTNAGNAALTITAATITGANASSFALQGNTCGGSLAAGANCTLLVRFMPSAAGTATATLSVTDAVGTQTANLSGIALAAVTTAPDFTLGATPAAQTGARGVAIMYSVQLRSVDATNPFTGAVTLSVSGLPQGASATFAPATVTPGTTQAAASQMTVTVPVLAAQNMPVRGTGRDAGAWAPRLACLFAPFGLAAACFRRRLPARLLALLCLFGVGMAVTGCGSGTGFALPASTQTLTITGTSGSIVHSTTVTLTVR